MTRNLLRIEDDESITELISKHNKYYLEYRLNVYSQGYEPSLFAQFAPLFFTIALSQAVSNMIIDSLIEVGVIKK